LLIGASSSAFAATLEAFEVEDGYHFLFLQGSIEAGDADRFRQLAASHSGATVVLESPGGSTIDAIEIGEAIRLKGFSTLVMNGSECSSACALIWLAGSPRVLTRSARVGLHATYIDRAGEKLESGVGNALVGRYLTLLNLPMKAIIFATQAPPDALNYLDASKTQISGIDVQIVDDYEFDDSISEAAQDVPPPIITTPVQPDSAQTEYFSSALEWLVMTDYTLAGSCFAVRFYPDGTVFRLNNDSRYSVKPDEASAFVFLSNPAWTSLELGEEFSLSYRLGSYDPWEGSAVVVEIGNALMLRTIIDASNVSAFKDEFANSNLLQIERDGRSVARLSLEASSRAIEELARCQNASNRKRKAADPFSD